MRIISRRRGNALVLAVFIILALTSVGIVSLQRTRTDLIVAGNLAQADTSNTAGQGGVVSGLSTTIQQQYTITSQVINTTGVAEPVWLGGQSSAIVAGGQYLPIELQPTNTYFAQHLPVVMPTNATDIPLAINQQKSAFDVMVVPLGHSVQLAANGIDQFCTDVWDVDSRGGIPGSQGELLSTTLGPANDFYANPTNLNLNTVIVRNRARAYFGPTKCSNTGKYK